MADKKTTDEINRLIEVTPAMMESGREAFRAIAERHGFEGLLNIGFSYNAISSVYLAMERERAGLPRKEDW
jgi:hypothetical protein